MNKEPNTNLKTNLGLKGKNNPTREISSRWVVETLHELHYRFINGRNNGKFIRR